MHEESQQNRAEVDRLRKGLEQEKVLRDQWETVLEETARALKQVLQLRRGTKLGTREVD